MSHAKVRSTGGCNVDAVDIVDANVMIDGILRECRSRTLLPMARSFCDFGAPSRVRAITIGRPYGDTLLAKPNYSFEKRQRELAKKKQQEDKDARKREEREAAKTAAHGTDMISPDDV